MQLARSLTEPSGVFCAFDPSIANMSPPIAGDYAGSAARLLFSGILEAA
jgi:hypothetical protein